jgi:hypothetical protein
VTKKDFIKLLNRTFNLPSAAIGHIDLNKAYMHFDIDGAYSAVVRQGLSEFTINGRRIRVDDASAPKAQPGREEKSFDKWNKKKRK